MRKYVLLLALLLAVTLTGCKKTEQLPEKELPEPVVKSEPLQMELLEVEISRGGLDTQSLMEAVKQLPELLERYFSKTDVEIGQVQVTVGASPADTAKALSEERIHVGFLPADGFLTYGGAGEPVLADAAKAEAGTNALICTAPTEYGKQLAVRAESKSAITWEELDNAHWGVLDAASLEGYRCFDLWLGDQYEGKRVKNLSHVTAYDSYEALFRAAAGEEIDALVIGNDARQDMAQAWTLDGFQTDEGGMHGFDRTVAIEQEVTALAVTETLYSQLVVVSSDMTDPRFVTALQTVVEQLALEEPDQMLLLGASHFAPVTDEALDPMRRLLTMEE